MTVAAVDAIIADVMFVAELHGLLTRNILPRQIGRSGHRNHRHETKPNQEKRRKNTESGNEIRAAMEDLSHFFVALNGERPRKESMSERPTY